MTMLCNTHSLNPIPNITNTDFICVTHAKKWSDAISYI